MSREDPELEARIAEEAALKRRLAHDKAMQMSDAEKHRLRELHFMRCPKCGLELEEIVLRGVHLDKCFGCNGLWLDAGELEELTGRAHEDLQAVADVFRSNTSGSR
jgi:hypothetical protein